MAVLGKLLKRSGGGCGGGEGPKDCGPSENLSAAKKCFWLVNISNCTQNSISNAITMAIHNITQNITYQSSWLFSRHDHFGMYT